MAISAWKYATVWTGRCWMIIWRRQHDLCVSYGKSPSSFDIVKDESAFCGWCDQYQVCSLASLPTPPNHYLFPLLLGIDQYRWFNFNHYLWMCVNKLDTWVSALSATITNNFFNYLYCWNTTRQCESQTTIDVIPPHWRLNLRAGAQCIH